MSLARHQHRTQIQQHWLSATATAVEAGRSPLLEMGMGRRVIDNIPMLCAFAEWDAMRDDLTQPLFVAGGSDTLWPAPFLHMPQLIDSNVAAAAPIRIIYGGADQATYLASLVTHATDHLPTGAYYAIDLPSAMRPLLASHTAPHTHATWTMLPFTLLHTMEGSAEQTGSPGTQAFLNYSTSAPVPLNLGQSWAALVLVVALILLSLFV